MSNRHYVVTLSITEHTDKHELMNERGYPYSPPRIVERSHRTVSNVTCTTSTQGEAIRQARNMLNALSTPDVAVEYKVHPA